MTDVVLRMVLAILQLMMLAIFVQVIISWLVVLGVRSPLVFNLYRAVTTINEPFMRPLRRIVPSIGMIDITPMVALFMLYILMAMVSAMR